ncbi:conserved membrane protein of unknown function [Thermococcus nautili]|uniref:hypothetical protein n=1 Tax=Thermococcus nautili TaxID=195522 RepID=UPI0025529EA9|nr:hypothetical protein [Thermococcus nautili]CAI1492700.1 conserved membrane protein of unknown function [Thermococcus nautili]
MSVCSRDWLWISLLLIFEAGYSIEYGLENDIVIILGLISGIALVPIIGYLLKNLDKDKLYGCKSYILGITITYEYLFGKKGTVRQLWTVFMLVSLPVSILTTYVSPVSSRQFWLFIVPMDIISTGITYCWLKKLIIPKKPRMRF